MGMHYRRGGVSSIASVLSLPRTPTGGCNACRAVASHLLRGHWAQRCSRLTLRSEAALALATMTLAVDCSGRSTAMLRVADWQNMQVRCEMAKMVLTALHDSFVRF